MQDFRHKAGGGILVLSLAIHMLQVPGVDGFIPLNATRAWGNASVSDLPTFRIIGVSHAALSAQKPWLYHIIPYAFKVAFEAGLLKVPNWAAFNVDIDLLDISFGQAVSSQANIAIAKARLPSMLAQSNVTAIIDDNPESVLGMTAMIASIFEVPIGSPQAKSDDLMQKKYYPSFFRTTPSESMPAHATARLCVQFGWYKIATLIPNKRYS